MAKTSQNGLLRFVIGLTLGLVALSGADRPAAAKESDKGVWPFGAKSVGEIGINGVAAAITNAVNAGLGVRLCQLPLTSERVLRAILGQEEQRGA